MPIQPEQFLEHFSNHLKNTIARAIALATGVGEDGVSPLHLLLALGEERGSIGAELLTRLNVDPKQIRAATKKTENGEPAEKNPTTTTLPELNRASKQVLERAMLAAYERSHRYVGTEHLLFGLFQSTDEDLTRVFKERAIDRKRALTEIEATFQSSSSFPDVADVSELMDELRESANTTDAVHDHVKEKERPAQRKKNPTALEVFTVNLTSRAIQKHIDPVVGRETEIERLIHILCRRTKNNPVLVGEPGVGKTAIVEGLAKRIVDGDVPEVLKRKKLVSLDLTLLLAGTIYRGEFEARLKQLMDELADKDDYILFIDEIHNIIGAGSNQGTMDAANMLKPALARGVLRCIGATTIDEYKKHIASDPALERRFQSISIEEPTEAETRAILSGVKKYYEDFHGVTITPDAIDTATTLSIKYIHDNFLPDKALDLLDEAAASVRVSVGSDKQLAETHTLQDALDQYREKKADAIHKEQFDEARKWKEKERQTERQIATLTSKAKKRSRSVKMMVTAKDIARVAARRLRIDEKVIIQNEWERLATLGDTLNQKIVGQESAITTVVDTLKRTSLKLGSQRGPAATFFFVGPSGVGKTALAKVLAQTLYHDPKALVRLDMTEFAESHSISKLLGSPAGYVGYKDRNRFTDELRKRPYAVVLFDEFDKAHSDVQKLLYQILDEGELTDNQGKKINLRHAVLVLTANADADLFRKKTTFGFGTDAAPNDTTINQYEKIKSLAVKRLKDQFGAALMGRLNAVCLFQPLTLAHVEKIVANHLEAMNGQLKYQGHFSIKADSNALKKLAEQSYSLDTGVRNADAVIEHMIHGLILELLAKKKQKRQYTLTVHANTYRLV